MKERVALITAASRGIGREIALNLAEEVQKVAIHYYQDNRAARKVAREVEEKNVEAAAFAADLTAEEEALRLVESVEEKFKRIDILVNNFGPFLLKPWEEVSGKEWEEIFRGNLLSAFYCMKAVLPGMRKRRWGRIINLGYSRAEQIVSFPNITPYAVAKTGLLILTRTVASSEISSGITVNMVSPGLIEGGILPQAAKEEFIGEFRDVAEAVSFLASEKAKHITGINLVVAGVWKL